MAVHHQITLVLQRAALIRAINRARECRADNDAEVLQSVVHLIEELHALAGHLPDKKDAIH